MKKQLLVSIVFMLVSSLGVFAQQTDFAKFLIRNAYVYGRDYSSHYRQAGAFLVLYDDDDEMSMAIVMEKRDSQSYGVVTDVDRQHYKATASTYERDVLKYNWHYQNSYDDKKGIATCRLEIYYTENGTLFQFEYVLTNGDTSRFSGMMEGSPKF